MKREKFDLDGNLIAEGKTVSLNSDKNEFTDSQPKKEKNNNFDDDFITSTTQPDDDQNYGYGYISVDDASDYIIPGANTDKIYGDDLSNFDNKTENTYSQARDFDTDMIASSNPYGDIVDISKKEDKTTYIPNKKDTKNKNFKKESDNAEKKKNNNQKNKKTIAAISALAIVIIAIACVCLFPYANINSGSNNQPSTVAPIQTEPILDADGENIDDNYIFANGISVCGVDLSGKTYAQAKGLVEQKALSLRTPLDITVIANSKTIKLTEDNFEFTYDTDKVLANAVAYSKKISSAAGSSSEDNKRNYDVTCTFNKDSIKSAVSKIAEKVDVEVKQAHVSKFTPLVKDKFKYAEGENGVEVDQDALTSDLTLFIDSKKTKGTINAKSNTIKPTITVDMVKKNIVGLSTYSTYSTNTVDGTHNMELSLSACNGSVIEPGAVWSFNTCTGDSNLTSKGYRPANVISGGKLQQGIGGGICQSSTTIYYAALYANMGVVSRYNHLWASAYADAGLDATIDYPNLDLKLKNNTEYQMFIESYMSGRNLIVNIYGYKEPFYDEIATYSKVHSITSQNFSASAYRIYYKDGKEVKREELPSSTYSLSEGHYVVAGDPGTKGKKPSDTANSSGGSSSGGSSSSKPISNSGNNGSSSGYKPKPKPTTPPTTAAPTTTQPVTQPPITTTPPNTTQPQTEAPITTEPVE